MSETTQHQPGRSIPVSLESTDGKWEIAAGGFRSQILGKLQGRENVNVKMSAKEGIEYALHAPGAKKTIAACSLVVRLEAEQLLLVGATSTDGKDVLSKPKEQSSTDTDPSIPKPSETVADVPVVNKEIKAREAGLRSIFIGGYMEKQQAAVIVLTKLLEKFRSPDDPASNGSIDRELSLFGRKSESPLFLDAISGLLRAKPTEPDAIKFQILLRKFLVVNADKAGPAKDWIFKVFEQTKPPVDVDVPGNQPLVGTESGKAQLTFHQALAKLESGNNTGILSALRMVSDLTGRVQRAPTVAKSMDEMNALKTLSKIIGDAEKPPAQRPKELHRATAKIGHEMKNASKDFAGLGARIKGFVQKAEQAKNNEKKN